MAKMPARTLKALKGSIAKWEAIVAGTGEDRGMDNCPLCQAFYRWASRDDKDCDGCPVKKATGLPMCSGSPYTQWDRRRSAFHSLADTPERKRLAQAELDFLRSLLPEGE